MTGHNSTLARTQPWRDPRPRALESSDVSVSSGGSSQPVMKSHAAHPAKDNKVAIPRVSNSAILTSNRRVGQACDGCREQKAKCSGLRPACQRCRESDIRCNYTDKK